MTDTPAKIPHQLVNDAVRLAERYDENFIELGKILRNLQDTDTDAFKQTYGESGLGSRKATYLARIARHTEHLDIPKAQLGVIGWTKAEIICAVLTFDNWPEWLEAASQHTARDLRVLVNGGTPVRGMRTVVLHFRPEDYQRFALAVATNGGKTNGPGLLHKERAILNIIGKAEVVDAV